MSSLSLSSPTRNRPVLSSWSLDSSRWTHWLTLLSIFHLSLWSIETSGCHDSLSGLSAGNKTDFLWVRWIRPHQDWMSPLIDPENWRLTTYNSLCCIGICLYDDLDALGIPRLWTNLYLMRKLLAVDCAVEFHYQRHWNHLPCVTHTIL